MKALAIIFLCMFLYGIVANSMGAGLIALFMCFFTLWAEKKFEMQDKVKDNNLHLMPTEHALEKHECECMKFTI